jgi:hypothetical protein
MIGFLRDLRPVAVVGFAALVGWNSTAWARPATTKLLPKTTQAYISIPDVVEFKARLGQSSIAEMLRDPQVAPLAEDLYGQGLAELAKLKEQAGVPTDRFIDIPTGEVAAALVTVKEGRPGFILFMDIGEDHKLVDKLLETGLTRARDEGIEPREEKVGETKITILDLPGEEQNQVMFFIREDTFVVSSSAPAMAEVIRAWDGDKTEPLSSDEAFQQIRDRARGEVDEIPQLVYFIDPIGIFEAVGEDNAMVRLGEAFLAPLGLDGLRGLGGSITLETGQYEQIHRATVLIDSPRRGVVELVATRPGDVAPESWVGEGVASYTTINWDFPEFYDDLRHLVDSFRGEGTFSKSVNGRVKDDLGIDLEQEVLPHLEGRFSIMQSMTRPVTITSQTAVYGFKLKEPEKFQPVLDKIGEKFAERLKKESYGVMNYYVVAAPEVAENPDLPRQPMPCFGILGDYLLIGNRPAALEQAVLASQDASHSLAGTEDYQLIMNVIKELPGGEEPTAISFARPEESMRFMYELATSEASRKRLAEQAESNDYFARLNEALEKNPLPPFEVIGKYFAPSGALLVDEETGWQYINFTLRRESTEEKADERAEE